MSSQVSPIILALDTQDITKAKEWIRGTNKTIKFFKVGLEFYLTHGSQGIAELREEGDFIHFSSNLFWFLRVIFSRAGL